MVGGSSDDLLPCILFMDSLKAHRKQKVAKKVRQWLNSEWLRLRGGPEEPFSRETMRVYDPRIPYQDNSWDCGVFVCRYAFALYQQRHIPITYAEIENDPIFKKTITKSPGFRFDMNDIIAFRKDMRTLIDRLAEIYAESKNKK